jgi:hypothetical protein
MTARGWKLKGYRPEASTVIGELRGRRSEPIKKGNTLDAEMRLCALYVAQPEMSLRALAAASHMRLGNVKKILCGWRWRTFAVWQLRLGLSLLSLCGTGILEKGSMICL